MSKKIWIPIIGALALAMFASLWMTHNAAAQADNPLQPRQFKRGAVGQVTEISAAQFSLQTPKGETLTFLLDEKTIFQNQAGEEQSREALQMGAWVLVRAAPGKDEARTARLVVLLAEDFDPAKQAGKRGLITSVDTAAQQFGLQTRAGEQVTFRVDEATRFLGQAGSLADLREGMRAGVIAQKQADENLLAEAVIARIPLEKYAGQFTAVDASAGTFTLKTRRGAEELTFIVDENTRFRSKAEQVLSLADLQPEMVGAVAAQKQEDGTLLAVMVAANGKEQLPKVDKRFLGRIVEIGENTITVETRQGEQIVIQVTEETRFRSQGNRVHSLSDLKEGMRVAVGALETSEGQYQAQVVLVGKR